MSLSRDLLILLLKQMFDRFLKTKARSSQVGDASPLSSGAVQAGKGESRMDKYKDDRNQCGLDSSSRMR